MLNIETKELKISDKLKRKIEMIGRFTNTTPITNNGSIKNITGTNVAYVMPHIIVIKNNKYLIFDECDDVYINTFNSKISFDYHNNYATPVDLFMFMDEDKFPIPVAHNGFRTRIEIENYVNKLKEMYDVNYYEVKPNKDFTNLSFTPKNDIEKIIRIIPIKDNDKFKSNKLELGVITINLSNIRSTDGTQLYKNIFKTSKVPT